MPPGSSSNPEKSPLYRKLLLKRGNAIKTIEFHAVKLAANQNQSEVEALARLSQIETNFEKFNEVVKELEAMDEYDEEDISYSSDEVVEIYIQTLTKLKSFIKEKDPSETIGSLNSTQMTARTHQEVKLPKIAIPNFNGDLLEWISFYDAFSSLIDTNQSLPEVSKMHYLRDCLSGTAFRLIGKLPVTETNYRLAWRLLCDRFHNKRAIINAHLNKFVSQANMETVNADEIRSLIDTIRESIQSVETMDVSIKDWDPILVFIIESKLDKETLKEWELHLGGTTEVPSYAKLMEFLETQWRIYDITHRNSSSSKPPKVGATRQFNDKKKEICTLCELDHWISYCPKFDAYNVPQRKKFVHENELCENCLQKHKTADCRSKYRCKTCGGKHHTKLHEPNSTTVNNIHSAPSKLLATAIVRVKDKFGMSHLLRVFIDQGSEETIISERAVQLLSLPRKSEDMPLTGLNDAPLGKANKSVRIQVESAINDFAFDTDALVMKSIIKPKTHDRNKLRKWKHLKNLDLADPDLLSDNYIDLLFGVDIYALILLDGLRKGKPHEPIAQNSEFGWLVFGAMSDQKSFNIHVHAISLSDQLQKFWKN